MEVVNIVVALVAIGVGVFGFLISSGLQNMSYVPPVLVASGIVLLLIVIVGIFSTCFNHYRLGFRYNLFRLYSTALGLLGSLIIVMAIFMYFVKFSVSAKMAMRYDLFYDSSAVTSRDSMTGEKATDEMVNPLKLGMIICAVLGVVVIVAFFFTGILTGFRAFVKNVLTTTAFVNVIFGIAMIVVGLYLILTYHFKSAEKVDITDPNFKPGDKEETETRVSLDKSLPLLYLFSFSGGLPLIIGIVGLISSISFAFRPISNTYIILSTTLHLILVGFLATLFVMFLMTYQDNVNADLEAFLGKMEAYAKEAHYILALFRDFKVSEVKAYLDDVNDALMAKSAKDSTLNDLLLTKMFDRVQSDFVLLGLVGFVPGLWSLLLVIVQIPYAILTLKRYGNIDGPRVYGPDNTVWKGEEDGYLRLLEGRIPLTEDQKSNSRYKVDKQEKRTQDDSDDDDSDLDYESSIGPSRRRRRR